MLFRHVTTRISGLIILIAGIWGGLIPFLGPTFHFTLGPDKAWHWTTGRLWLDVLPAAAAVLGGLILMGGGPRLSGRIGALFALAGGIWFAVGPDVSMLWNHGVSQAGVAHGHHTITRMLEFLTLHSGIGVLITALAAYALPGLLMYRVARGVVGTGAAVGAAAAAGRRGRGDRDEDEGAREGERAGAGAAGGTPAGAGAAPGASGGGAAPGAGAGAAPGAGGGGAAPGVPAPLVEGHPADPTAPRAGPVAGAAAAGEAAAAQTGAGASAPAGDGVAPGRTRRRGLFSRR
jgi:hypothetical protein